MTKGTILEVNVSELGLVTTSGKVVWSKYAQVTNNPENDGCVNTVLLVVGLAILLGKRTLICSDFRDITSIFGEVGMCFFILRFVFCSRRPVHADCTSLLVGCCLGFYVHVPSILYHICISKSEMSTMPDFATSSRVYRRISIFETNHHVQRSRASCSNHQYPLSTSSRVLQAIHRRGCSAI